MNELKRKVLYFTVLLGVTIAYIATKFVAKDYHYPIAWLRHFLIGSGRDMRVPSEIVDGAMGALIKAIERDAYGTIYNNGTILGRFCVDHSTLYEGSGFHGRPTLFYLLGGFTFELSVNNGVLIAKGQDEYDWHSDGTGRYFSSPLGNNPIIKGITTLAGAVFGKDLFCVGSNDSMICAKGEEDNARISNKLWETMYGAGAKSFNSVFEVQINKSNIERIVSVFYNVMRDYDEEDRNYEDDDCEEEWYEEEYED